LQVGIGNITTTVNGTYNNSALAKGTQVTLTAVPDGSSDFAGWNGGGCSGTASCSITMDSNKNVVATFNGKSTTPQMFALTINKGISTGTGTVTSSPPGRSCTGSCTATSTSYAQGTEVTLTAIADSGSSFSGWGGGSCSGTGNCLLTITATTTITATFSVNPPTPTFAGHVQPIFTANCAPCHVGSTSGGLSLSVGASYSNLVNVPSQALPSMNRIKPNDPQNSYLLHKIKGTQGTIGGSGSQMPLNRSPLLATDIKTIEDWVNAGAPNN
jgi:hypothetical protein